MMNRTSNEATFKAHNGDEDYKVFDAINLEAIRKIMALLNANTITQWILVSLLLPVCQFETNDFRY
jgi:hypothetical protein